MRDIEEAFLPNLVTLAALLPEQSRNIPTGCNKTQAAYRIERKDGNLGKTRTRTTIKTTLLHRQVELEPSKG